MVDEIPRKDATPDLRTDPELLLDRRWIGLMVYEHCEEIVELIRPILKKSLGLNPMTEDEQALANFFGEEALTIDDNDD